jgi:hypothetical protein
LTAANVGKSGVDVDIGSLQAVSSITANEIHTGLFLMVSSPARIELVSQDMYVICSPVPYITTRYPDKVLQSGSVQDSLRETSRKQ